MDALSHILDSVKLKAVVYQKISFTSSWGIAVAQDANSQFWRLLKGSCYVRIPGQKMIKMEVGDFVFVPHGSAHLISGAPDSMCVPSAEYVRARQSATPMFVGNDEETLMIGGHFEFAPVARHPFINSLPVVLHIADANTEVSQWMQQIAMFMNAEVNASKPGSTIVLGRLAEVLFVLIIRAYLEQEKEATGFLAAFKDPRISDSLSLMHEAPEKNWTLQQLAVKAGMSRSLYCKQFKHLTGETPLGYLTHWRILKAKELLAKNKSNIREIALQVGYQSEAAFNRVFKSKAGETPAAYRRKLLP